MPTNRLNIWKWLGVWSGAGCAAVSLAAGSPPAPAFGFTGPEIFPIDEQISQIHAADLDGDGLKDLVVVNNLRSKINLLFNQTGRTNRPAKAVAGVKREINELPPDARFRIESVASEKRISSLTVADLNSDGRPDLAYYGEPKELVVLYNDGKGGWNTPKRWPIDDAQLNPNGMTHGDLNNDHREDLVLLADSHLYVFYQSADHKLGEPEKIPFSGAVKAVQILDINADQRLDVLLVNWDSPNPFRFRLQGEAGQLGPETHFSLPPIRSYWADDLDADGRAEVITIAQQSGRAQISMFTQRPAEPLLGTLKQGQFQVLPLKRNPDKAPRGMGWADVNQDQLSDLLVAEPNSGQLSVYLQQSKGGLAEARSFPTLTGVSEISVADWDGDGRPEIFLLSAAERQVGVTQRDADGRVPFPTMISLEGKPLAMAVAPLQSGGRPMLAVIVDQDGKRSLQTRGTDGKTKTLKLGDSFKSNPSELAIHDVNQDGLPDLLVLIPYEKIKVLLQNPAGTFEEMDVAPPGGSMEQPWLSRIDVDGDGKVELLLAQKNFLRAVVLEKENGAKGSNDKPAWTFKVKEQINGASSNSRIVGAAALQQGAGNIPSLFLLDAERKALTVCERDRFGVWQTVRNLPLPVSEFSELHTISLGATRPNSVAFLGMELAAWMSFQGDVWEFTELDGYESPIKGGYLMDVVSGDLNQDGRKDLVFLETAKNHLDIVTFEPPHQLIPANRWRIFEERTFRSRRGDSPEPREALIVDLNGDGKNDLAIVVHDRVLVYPQE